MSGGTGEPARMPALSAEHTSLQRAADLALDAIRRDWPYHLPLLMRGPDDLRLPRELSPSFGGAFDWHSSVHGHWCVLRALRWVPEWPSRDAATAALDASLTPDHVAAEVALFRAPGRDGFERPYGLAWLLQLAAELREAARETADARRWADAMAPLERLAIERMSAWLPRLTHPIRGGEHSQTAFAMGLALDHARASGEAAFEAVLVERALAFHRDDAPAPLGWEPSGHDFLSPALGVADLMRRVMAPGAFASWAERFFAELATPAGERWRRPVRAADRADGKLAHLDGLNLSRAWMLEGVVSALPPGLPLRDALEPIAADHRTAGLAGYDTGEYAGSHWLGSFAAYLLTRRGIA